MAAKNSRYKRQDDPPPMGKVLHVLKCRDKERFTVIVLSEAIWGCFTHWNGRRTVRCHPIPGQCTYCNDQVARRWCGFLHVCNRDRSGESFLELTQYAGHKVKALQTVHGVLRGQIVHVFRERGSIKSPLALENVGFYAESTELPSPKTPELTLDRLWTLASPR